MPYIFTPPCFFFAIMAIIRRHGETCSHYAFPPWEAASGLITEQVKECEGDGVTEDGVDHDGDGQDREITGFISQKRTLFPIKGTSEHLIRIMVYLRIL